MVETVVFWQRQRTRFRKELEREAGDRGQRGFGRSVRGGSQRVRR